MNTMPRKKTASKEAANVHIASFVETSAALPSVGESGKVPFTNTKQGIQAAAIRAAKLEAAGDAESAFMYKRFVLGVVDSNLPSISSIPFVKVSASIRATLCFRTGLSLYDKDLCKGLSSEILSTFLSRNMNWPVPRKEFLEALIESDVEATRGIPPDAPVPWDRKRLPRGTYLSRSAIFGFLADEDRQRAVEALASASLFERVGDCVAHAPITESFRDEMFEFLLENDTSGAGVLSSLLGRGLSKRVDGGVEKLLGILADDDFSRRALTEFFSPEILSVISDETLSKVLSKISKLPDMNLFDPGERADFIRIQHAKENRASFFKRLSDLVVSEDESILGVMRTFFMSPSGRRTISEKLSSEERENRKKIAEKFAKMWDDALHDDPKSKGKESECDVDDAGDSLPEDLTL